MLQGYPLVALLLAVGGLAYSVGAVLNLFRWPALWTGVFGTHELFHLFVLAGSLAHYWFMLKVIVPFVREPGPAHEGRVPVDRGGGSSRPGHTRLDELIDHPDTCRGVSAWSPQ